MLPATQVLAVAAGSENAMAAPLMPRQDPAEGGCGAGIGSCPSGQCCSEYGYWYVNFFVNHLFLPNLNPCGHPCNCNANHHLKTVATHLNSVELAVSQCMATVALLEA